MSVALLWAVLAHGTASYAYHPANLAQGSPAGIVQGESVNGDNGLTGVQQGLLYLAQEGTTASLTYSFFQPAATVSKALAVWFTGHGATPPYAARAPGDSFFCQFFYTSSQPQAP